MISIPAKSAKSAGDRRAHPDSRRERNRGKGYLHSTFTPGRKCPSGAFVKVKLRGQSQEALLESELFGYERGSFTDAHTSKARATWKWRTGGHSFLDEIRGTWT